MAVNDDTRTGLKREGGGGGKRNEVSLCSFVGKMDEPRVIQNGLISISC